MGKKSGFHWKTLRWLLVLVLGAGLPNSGRAGSAGSTGMSFLKVGAGARAAAMGEAYTALATDALATYWNPAGLAAGAGSSLVLMHNRWFLDVASNFAALQWSMVGLAWGMHVYHFNVGDIQVRQIPSSEPLETVSAQYLSLGASVARRLSPSLSAGLTVKYLFEKIHLASAPGLALDAGVRFRPPGTALVLAAAVQHIGRMGRFARQRTRLPATLRVGAALPVTRWLPEKWQLWLSTEASKPREEAWHGHFGVELGLWHRLYLRGGWQTGRQFQRSSFGIGIQQAGFRLDYSYSPLPGDLGNGQRFSFSASW